MLRISGRAQRRLGALSDALTRPLEMEARRWLRLVLVPVAEDHVEVRVGFRKRASGSFYRDIEVLV
jgi:hypothetical protein